MSADAVPSETRGLLPVRVLIGYLAMVGLTILVFLFVRSYGEGLTGLKPHASIEAIGETTEGNNTFLRILIALTAIIITGQVFARLFAYLSQPPVIGEVVAGILLGPSLLGPDISALVLPPSVAPYLGVIAQFGVILYMFLVGIDLNPALLKHRAHATVATSHASILFPFALGAILALFLYPSLANSEASFTSFALFMGVAMSITAFPVLARILADYGMTRTRLGVVALSCAAVDDVTAWCLLAFVVGVAKAQMGEGLFVVVGALAFIACMLLLVRPAMEWSIRRFDSDQQSRGFVILIFMALLLSALTAEAIGIHAIFGAFLLGVVIPHESATARFLTRQLESVVTILFLPAFFALTGMRTRIDLLLEPSDWMIFGLITVVATVGKFGGTLAAARLTGLEWGDAAMLGTLMNTRGLMELIVLNIGLDLRVISPSLFAMMVLMAITTTALTSPVLRLLIARSARGSELELRYKC